MANDGRGIFAVRYSPFAKFGRFCDQLAISDCLEYTAQPSTAWNQNSVSPARKMMKIPIVFLSIITWGIVNTAQPAAPPSQDFPDVCQEPGNILTNCDFNNGLENWEPYLESGSANITYLQGGGECHAPLCPAAYINTKENFIGGIYQQVSVTPGNTYYANIVWLAFDSLVNDPSINAEVGGIGRRIGIDPFGGTNPGSDSVVWSEDNWRNDCKICNVEHVTVTAQADQITIFIRIDDTWRSRAAEKGYSVPASQDQFWLDDIGLKQVDGSEAPPPPTEAPPTDTPPAPTDTPVPASPTDTPEPAAPTDTPQPTDEPETEIAQLDSAETEAPLSSPTPTSEQTSPIAPPPTLTPSATPSPTSTPEPRPAATTTRRARTGEPSSEPPLLSAGLLGTIGTTACVGGLVLLIMAAVMAGAVWLYRLGWGQADDDDDFDEFDEADEIIVEIDE
jgi:hypothetical protein